MGAGAHALGHQFGRIFIADFIETELTALCDTQGVGDQRIGVKGVDLLAATQMTFTVGEEASARIAEGAAVADAGQHILQRAPLALMHMHIAASN